MDKNKLKRAINKTVFGAFAISSCCLLMTGCGSTEEAAEESTETSSAIAVSVENPQKSTVSIDSRFAATVDADTVNVVPLVAGEVTSKFFEVGDHVNEGDLLFTIDDEAARIAVDQANASLTTAKANYDTTLAQNASAQAQSGVTFAGILENEEQLKYSLNSAKAGSIEAQYSANSAHRTVEYYEAQITNINDDISNANSALDTINSAISKAKKAGADTTALETQKSSIKSTISTLESTKDQMEMYRDTGRNSAGSADTAYMNTLEAIKLAELQLADYQKYSEVAAMWGINASLVAADSSLKSADAAVKQAKANV
ncbi:MAG: biotin/lipoyl-binding protein, partial [Lachnospiraceae bacterium]|nr:biotin/lipoyl-binding protein [Lachnospiraceae bacterium]